jgi:hypothetical protein
MFRERDLWCGTQSQGQIIATYFCSKTYQVRQEKQRKKRTKKIHLCRLTPQVWTLIQDINYFYL